MLVLVAYDVNTEDSAGKKRLRKVAKICVSKGSRVQNSVFECLLDEGQYRKMKSDLSAVIDSEKDNLRFYRLGNSYEMKIETLGRCTSFDHEGVWIL